MRKRHGFLKGWGIVLSIALVSVPALSNFQATQVSSDYGQGLLDGGQAAKGSPLWILGGALCGVFAVIYCYVQSVSPPAAALVGKSTDYVLGYSEGYKAKRGRDAVYAWVGWGVWIIIYVALVLPNMNSDI